MSKDSAEWAAVVRAVVAAIPVGQVLSYAGVARRAGRPRHARLVARILAESSGMGLPWHRVMRADGRPGFAEGSPGWREQLQRLRSEGVEVRAGRVRMPRAVDSLDAALWGPPP